MTRNEALKAGRRESRLVHGQAREVTVYPAVTPVGPLQEIDAIDFGGANPYAGWKYRMPVDPNGRVYCPQENP